MLLLCVPYRTVPVPVPRYRGTAAVVQPSFGQGATYSLLRIIASYTITYVRVQKPFWVWVYNPKNEVSRKPQETPGLDFLNPGFLRSCLTLPDRHRTGTVRYRTVLQRSNGQCFGPVRYCTLAVPYQIRFGTVPYCTIRNTAVKRYRTVPYRMVRSVRFRNFP